MMLLMRQVGSATQSLTRYDTLQDSRLVMDAFESARDYEHYPCPYPDSKIVEDVHNALRLEARWKHK